MSTIVKGQHFVPKKAHLNKFCDDDGYLYVYDKDKLNSFRTTPHNVAKKHRFYDFPEAEDRQKQKIERFFSKIEPIQDSLIEDFLEKVYFHQASDLLFTDVLTTDLKIKLASVISLQFLRTNEHRKFISNVFQSTKHNLKQEADQIHKQGMRAILERIPEEYKSLVASFLIETKQISINNSLKYINWLYSDEGLSIVQGEEIFRRFKNVADILVNHIWLIGFNSFGKNQAFYTSDHPVAKLPHLSGIASKGVQINFPLNSNVIIILLEREYFNKYEAFDNKIVQLTTYQINHFNSMQVFSSDRQIYCRNKDFDLAEQIIKNSFYDLSSAKQRY